MGDFYGLKKNNETFGCNDATARSSISLINEKIPSVASSNNKLVDTSAMNTALAGKVDKVAGKGLSTNDYSDEEKSKVTSNAEAIEAMVNRYGAKNLLPNNATSQTKNGVTFTVNADGSVTANGTATETAILYMTLDYANFAEMNKTLISHGIDNIPDRVHLFFQTYTGKTFEASKNGMLINGIGNDDHSYSVFIYIEPNVTVSNLTFYPMIRDARIADSTYVPYAMTNRELTDIIPSTIRYQYVGESIDAGQNERRPSFDFTGKPNGLYFCILMNSNTVEPCSMCLIFYGRNRGLSFFMASNDSSLGAGWTVDDIVTLSSNIAGWNSFFDVYRILPF